ncbi:hypothetical protein B0A55_04575 [Friedmanniomyces simplex]|uniref:Uncharacterized protein n=1 Tax=Friedmanniomyces simplex TaxID=329884 RepID=A0A4U0XH80_9PEZI|nr:hypothetical protein B0A55_04575 [Friedmanniomyces simplex]
MDPLSVAANIIAVTQAVTTSGMLLSKVLQLRHASGEYQALFNEVEALRSLLLIIKTALVRITGSKLYEEIREPVQVLLFSVQSAVQDLHTGGQQRAVNSGRPEAYNFLIGVGAQQAVEEGSRGNRTAQAMALSTTDYRDYVLDDDAVAEELGFTVLHLSVALPSSERPLTEQSLKRQHENINARDRNGMTPLSWACRRGDLAATELLIDWNADVNSQDKLGRSLSVRSDSGNTISSMLSFASRSTGSRRSRQLLLAPAVATKSSAWTFTKDGDTILHLAARHAGTAVMKVLAGADLRGIDPDQRSRRGSTPDDCFYQHRDEDLLVDRSPSEQAEQAWEGLMSAVMLQNGLIGRVEDAEESCTAINDHDDKRQDKNEAFSKFQSSFSGIQLDESAVMGEDAIFVDAMRSSALLDAEERSMKLD